MAKVKSAEKRHYRFKKLRLPKWLQRIRASLSQQVKMTILMVVGFTLVFLLIGSFSISQFRTVMYGNAESRVDNAFNIQANRFDRPVVQTETAQITDYVDSFKHTLNLPKANRVYLREYRGSWYFFNRHGDELAYVDVTAEHELVESYQTRLFWIYVLSELALLLMGMALTRANMRPIIRSWNQQRTFVADAAHEFKTPMTVIQNNLERMLEHPNDTVMDQVESVANALTEVRHLNHLTGDLLTLSQADADIPMFAFEEMDLAETVREVGDIYEYNANEKNQTLKVDVPKTLPIIGDAQRLRQLLVILTDNAQKYAGEGANVTITAISTSSGIKITVADTGKGVSEEDKKHLFDRFYRIDKARSRSTGGHGLGLSIAKWVVQGHRGTIEILDNKPHGTIFKILIPKNQKGAS
ncbi:HAMP domain-containing sensor histidine kinase [Weissella paramesenteroides]|uniref:sensor histidine kinase n=1 Tax=Weissella paramesenteroides TaxID=1249 RepID=UPI00207406AA|nr:HAMP domain-containing sensor histidine kinase [Weissella paramesenteroides]MCM6766417.1 HAMP domain-containing histidine kinase [Weissella paramesenteroides]MCM6767793.1 HAMP domain-containing histidine kinase [Weissella paramesenteroides]MCM6768433.1 HAMP domain-containing histidine kinase [Weissella paramesenteroides]MCM6770508.1 HAMP domain-containing histidine kinase [Weissella paramesenteroides]MCM6780431.1 HAMP domain-containing histidine kinase [Weissella paramesenteroides]